MFQKIRNTAAGVAAGSLALIGSANAALPTEITTALADMKTDGLAVAGAVVLAVLVVAAVKFLRSAK